MTPRIHTIGFKLDGVIHLRNVGWQDGAMYGQPVPGALDYLRKLLNDPTKAVFVSTLRVDLDSVVEWFTEYGLPAEADRDPERMFWRETDRVLVTGRPVTAQLRVVTNAVVFTGEWDAVDEALGRLN